jgi:hypothetical protein
MHECTNTFDVGVYNAKKNILINVMGSNSEYFMKSLVWTSLQ